MPLILAQTRKGKEVCHKHPRAALIPKPERRKADPLPQHTYITVEAKPQQGSLLHIQENRGMSVPGARAEAWARVHAWARARREARPAVGSHWTSEDCIFPKGYGSYYMQYPQLFSFYF